MQSTEKTSFLSIHIENGPLPEPYFLCPGTMTSLNFVSKENDDAVSLSFLNVQINDVIRNLSKNCSGMVFI